MQYINNHYWPLDLKLSLEAANWDEWSFQVTLLADRQGLHEYLEGTLSIPNKAAHPCAHYIWQSNNRSFKAFLFSRISRNNYHVVASCTTSHDIFEGLQKIHEKQGPHAKMVLLQKAMSIRYRSDVSFSTTMEEIDALHTRIINMGQFNNDQL